VEREQQLAELRATLGELAEDRRAAAQQGAALQGAELEREEARRALRERERELRQQREEAARSGAQWREQVVKLVAEAQAAERRAVQLAEELRAALAENERLTESAQELVLRYEEESGQRLEFEERCISLEEKLHAREQHSRSAVDSAQQKTKLSLQARQRAEELSKHHDERSREAIERAEQAELRCRGLEAELQRLKSLCSERGRRLDALEWRDQSCAPVRDTMPRQPAGEAAPSLPPPSRLPLPPTRLRASSRPGTGSSINSAPSAGSAPAAAASGSVQACSGGANLPAQRQARAAADDPGMAARLPPGTIRRAGSVPANRAPGRLPEPRSRSVMAQQLPRAAPSRRPCAPSWSRPSSRAGSELAEPEIDNHIPSEPDDSSDGEA